MGQIPVPLVIVVVVLLFVFAKMALRIIRPFEKGLIEFLGKFNRTAGPGLAFIIPIFETIRKVDMREQVLDVPPQDVITKDNVAVTVDAIVYFKITDPFKVLYNIADFMQAAVKLSQTNLRNVIGDMLLDETLTSREKINVTLREVLDEATDAWGVKVTRVELQKIDPPADITSAMSKQMKAEREKRAVILEAEGIRQSQITQAEGERQKKILEAEGYRQKQILEAEGKAQAIKNVADAEKYQIELVYDAIHNGRPTNDLIAIKYLEALEKVANGQATKIFLPLETSGVLGSIGGIAELFKDKKKEEKK